MKKLFFRFRMALSPRSIRTICRTPRSPAWEGQPASTMPILKVAARCTTCVHRATTELLCSTFGKTDFTQFFILQWLTIKEKKNQPEPVLFHAKIVNFADFCVQMAPFSMRRSQPVTRGSTRLATDNIHR